MKPVLINVEQNKETKMILLQVIVLLSSDNTFSLNITCRRLDDVCFKRILFQTIESLPRLSLYSVYQRFGQAKFVYGGSILRSSPFFACIPAASKFDARYKTNKKLSKINILLL